jgi:hypothetical protein
VLKKKNVRVIDIEAGKKFLAFRPMSDMKAPVVKNTSWPADDVNGFILAKLEAAGLAPDADADAYTWLRRVSLYLTGFLRCLKPSRASRPTSPTPL